MPTTSGIALIEDERGSDKSEPVSQRFQAGEAKTFAAPAAQRKARLDRDHNRNNYDLSAPSVEDWKHLEPNVLEQCYEQIRIDFFGIVDEYLNQANFAASRYTFLSHSHSRWRFWTIIATGGLAAINICAAFDLAKAPIWGAMAVPALLSAVAAVYAGCRTVAGNVESFLNRAEQAAGFRESRDILLTRYRDYTSKWVCYVESYGKTPVSCMNAARLYRELVSSDQEIRQKLKQLTETKGKEKGKPSGAQR
jgi:hypothetical protein